MVFRSAEDRLHCGSTAATNGTGTAGQVFRSAEDRLHYGYVFVVS